ncbi:MAG TPA: LacI family DNA-binding transcriptional regulator, partial [Chloroflexota bacterium]|nr:LacI family DNA-binding transcriptional regulator [Chloroflexota bacterium]
MDEGDRQRPGQNHSTIYEVARHAGVSVATVSRLLNGSGYVGAMSRERIQAAVAELGYEPNMLARSLVTKRSGMLALLLTDIENPFSAQIARGVQDVVQAAGYVPIICNITDDARSEIETVRLLRRRRIDGIILTPSQGEWHQEVTRGLYELCERGLAMVCIGRHLVHPRADEVSTDTTHGAMAAVAHLTALGHRRVGFIGGRISRGVALGRLTGYRAGLAAAGIAVDPALIREGDLDEESGRRETHVLLEGARSPTAIFCVNDRMAFGALAALSTLGLRAPEDVSVVGFDDIPLAALVNPPLTTVRQPTHDL